MRPIESIRPIRPMIYAYTTPGVPYHDGWTKIGYTERDVTTRIKEQVQTADITAHEEWRGNAIYDDGTMETFTDREFHRYLRKHGIKRQNGKDGPTEWFQISGTESEQRFHQFRSRKTAETPEDKRRSYTLRTEQTMAVAQTKAHFASGGIQFLWNAKPRFGKTLATYDLIREMRFMRVLVLTNRPSISNSWAEDFRTYISHQAHLHFVCENDALRNEPGVYSYAEHVAEVTAGADYGFVAFESLQGLKGSLYFGGSFDKLKWIADWDFDLVVLDEAHEGVETWRTERALKSIKRHHTLYLSGTPFKQLAGGQFADGEIFNWSYADEQEAKTMWEDTSESVNPYRALPRLEMYTYRMSSILEEEMKTGIIPDEESAENSAHAYAFDLNEFFATNSHGRFIHEDSVRRFLDSLTQGTKYPFSTKSLRNEMAHTLWRLNHVAAAKALKKLLDSHPIFSDYEIVLVAGDGKTEEDIDTSSAANEQSLKKVRRAIAQNRRTITLSVNRLTVGTTIPEWSGVLMLCNLSSPSSYMQTVFRAQNPYEFTGSDGNHYRKETAYVFDFDPARTLAIYDAFACNLSSSPTSVSSSEREENISRLLNFFPVIGEDESGEMIELDASAVLSIPRTIKSEEVVRSGFMHNFLFTNIHNVFGAPAQVQEIINQLHPAQEEKKPKEGPLEEAESIYVNPETGNIEILNEVVIGQHTEIFGTKIYASMPEETVLELERISDISSNDQIGASLNKVSQTIIQQARDQIITPAIQHHGSTKKQAEQIEKTLKTRVDNEIRNARADFEQRQKIARAEYERQTTEATENQSTQAANAAKEQYDESLRVAKQSLIEEISKIHERNLNDEFAQHTLAVLEEAKQRKQKKDIESQVRAHLRGFSRTIPSFLMAYGDENLTLANIDDYTEDDVFLELTGITEEQFRFLRDGGEYIDEFGQEQHFEGHLFDEIVFNDSVRKFLRKKEELADYFNPAQDEDIFDYIPPQRTNQIFVPRNVVEQMVNELEAHNPGCFDDPEYTFADLHIKSGMYLTEIVKRLYSSAALTDLYPNDKERLRHIFTTQIYGIAPTRIIYLIAMEYMLGFNPDLRTEVEHLGHIACADSETAAKEGKLQELVDKLFDS